MRNILLLFALFVVLSGGAQVKTQQHENQWWLAAKDCPLQFSSSTERYLDLFNASQDTVTSYTLGCVLEANDGYVVTKRFAARTTKMKPRDAFMDPKPWYQRTYLAKCQNPTAKLAVVEVRSLNGSLWALSPSKVAK